LDEAIDDLSRAAGLLPGQHQAHANLAQAYHQQGKWQEAASVFDRAIPVVDHPAALYRTRARLFLERGKPSAALGDLQKAIERESPRLADDHVERGHIFHRGDKYAEAVQEYEEALRIAPDHADAHRWRAAALVELKQYGEAIRSFDRYLEQGKPDA